jgi:hypothetical protein
VAPDGTVYASWSANYLDSATTYGPEGFCSTTAAILGCHSVAVLSKSSDGGATWSAPAPFNPALDAQKRTPLGTYSGTGITPNVHRVDTFWPAIAITPSGRVYVSAYAADVVSPWLRSDGTWVNNARLDYVAKNLGAGTSRKVTTHPVNTRYQFSGTFIGDYTGAAAGSDEVLHTLWTDTNNVQGIVWFFGQGPFNPPLLRHQQDVATSADKF